jgi:hypothetical protein
MGIFGLFFFDVKTYLLKEFEAFCVWVLLPFHVFLLLWEGNAWVPYLNQETSKLHARC